MCDMNCVEDAIFPLTEFCYFKAILELYTWQKIIELQQKLIFFSSTSTLLWLQKHYELQFWCQIFEIIIY